MGYLHSLKYILLPAVTWHTSDTKSLFVVIARLISWISIDRNMH